MGVGVKVGVGVLMVTGVAVVGLAEGGGGETGNDEAEARP